MTEPGQTWRPNVATDVSAHEFGNRDMPSIEDIELGFDRFFAKEGYRRVNSIVGDSPDFFNADYIQLDYRAVVELKILDKDYFAEGGIIDRFCSVVPKPVNVDPYGYGVYSFTLPPSNREGRHDTFEEPMRRILKKANRQLKETIDRLLDGNGSGFVVLALNRFRSLQPAVVKRMVDELLEREFSSITGYMLCTPGWGVLLPNSTSYGPVCFASVAEGAHEDSQHYWHTVTRRWCDFTSPGGQL